MTTYLDAVKASLPEEYAARINSLDAPTTSLLEALVRFTSGGECPSDAKSSTQTQWSKQQTVAASALERLKSSPNTNHKRAREDDVGTADEPDAKKPKSDESDKPLFTLHALSVSSPLRKKLNITVHQSSIRLTNPTTNATELSVPLATLKRAFLLPTRGKTKPHWTVLIMAADTPSLASTAKGAAKEKDDSQMQIVFGVDAVPPPFSVTDHTTSSEPTSNPKGTPILPSLQTFLSHLPFRVLEPSTAVFKSALSSGDGSAGVEGYRGAKSGTLWFLSEGILWDGKPGEFWALQDLVGGRRGGAKGVPDVDLGGAEGVRTVSATGRTCSVILSRKVGKQAGTEDGEEDEDEDGEQSVDTDVGMVDGKEQEGIARWVKKHRHLFGVIPVDDGAGPSTAQAPPDEDDSDEDDSDFADESSSDGGSPSESSDEGSDDEGGGRDGGDDGDAQSEDLGSGSERSDDGDDEEEAEGGEGEEAEEEDLDPAHHPLLRPGAMPKMSRAAIDAVVGMVQDDLMSGTTNLERRGANDTGESADEEEDELED
ncbi:hypothetical protein EIP91_009604 [Steccherinum ochraceum]|uniref:Histone chaperone RTT106/FACT complex subunit SPT16-like middle domain-containing protein n=1 Tax=Steccherinum ochraceum TaxID=92696 RepID=A0A4R0R1H8_9APHY|nr:hypothetical protein EIP91_009604 [Steccherinum ochraceum]